MILLVEIYSHFDFVVGVDFDLFGVVELE